LNPVVFAVCDNQFALQVQIQFDWPIKLPYFRALAANHTANTLRVADLHPAIEPIGDKNTVFLIDDDRARPVEGAGEGSLGSECSTYTLLRAGLDAVIPLVSHQYSSAVVDGDIPWKVKAAKATPPLSESTQQVAIGTEDLNAVGVSLNRVNPVLCIHRHPVWISEIAGAPASTTESLTVSELVAYLDAVVLGIGNDQPVPAVYDHSQRKVELACILPLLTERTDMPGCEGVTGKEQ
jgi:hypothetical protein